MAKYVKIQHTFQKLKIVCRGGALLMNMPHQSHPDPSQTFFHQDPQYEKTGHVCLGKCKAYVAIPLRCNNLG